MQNLVHLRQDLPNIRNMSSQHPPTVEEPVVSHGRGGELSHLSPITSLLSQSLFFRRKRTSGALTSTISPILKALAMSYRITLRKHFPPQSLLKPLPQQICQMLVFHARVCARVYPHRPAHNSSQGFTNGDFHQLCRW